MTTQSGHALPDDWYPGTVPANVVVDASAYIGTSYVFSQFRSERPTGLRLGHAASLCKETVLDVGPLGEISIGDFSLVTGPFVSCDGRVEIEDYALVSWGVVIIDTYRFSQDPAERRVELEQLSTRSTRRPIGTTTNPRPVRIGRNAWIGFEACLLPGIIVGEGAIVGARSVVADDVPPFSVVVGNPARVVQQLQST